MIIPRYKKIQTLKYYNKSQDIIIYNAYPVKTAFSPLPRQKGVGEGEKYILSGVIFISV